MGAALLWWAAVQTLSLAVIPLAHLLFRALPDRGYAFTKVLGPLTLTLLLWWSGSLGLLPNQRGTVLLLTYFLVLGGLAASRLLRRPRRPSRWLWERPSVLATEAVFTLTFAFWVLVRAYSPDIDSTEKPMDFAFLNASYRARFFPPEDPWLSGFPVSYYYLGYLNAATLTKLVDVPTSVGFNLALATVAAQAAAAAFGLVYNLAEGLCRGLFPQLRRRWSGPLWAGLLAAVLLLGVGSLEGALEFGRSRGWGNDALWRWVDVPDLKVTPPSATWYPDDTWFWWRATRIIHTTENGKSLDYTITEFPFFSFLLGDLHPHVMALPLVLMTLGLALHLLLARQPPQAFARRPLAVFGPAALLGALFCTNVWDLPALGAVVLIAGGLRWAMADGPPVVRAGQWALWAVAVGLGALLLYAPFIWGLAGAGQAVLGGGSNGGPIAWWTGPGSRPLHLLLLWGLLFLAAGWFLWGALGRLSSVPRIAARAGLLVPLVLGVLMEMLVYPGGGDTAYVVPRLWFLGPLAAALALLWWLAVGERDKRGQEHLSARPSTGSGRAGTIAVGDALAVRGEPVEPRAAGPSTSSRRTEAAAAAPDMPAREGTTAPAVPDVVGAGLKPAPTGVGLAHKTLLFNVGLVAAALVLLQLCEMVFLRDVFHNRMNTVFKLTYQAWTFLVVASAFGLYYLYATGAWGRGRPVALGILAVAGCLAFLYAPLALFNRTEGFRHPPTLDGLAFVARTSPAQRSAVDWLANAATGRRTVILEASGPQYSGFSLMSSRTGVPTLLGWPGHESQWRGPLPVFQERQQAIDQMYRAQDKAAVLPVLHRYGVEYVIVGPPERSAYPPEGLNAFDATLEVAFRQDNVTIYRVPGPAESRQ